MSRQEPHDDVHRAPCPQTKKRSKSLGPSTKTSSSSLRQTDLVQDIFRAFSLMSSSSVFYRQQVAPAPLTRVTRKALRYALSTPLPCPLPSKSPRSPRSAERVPSQGMGVRGWGRRDLIVGWISLWVRQHSGRVDSVCTRRDRCSIHCHIVKSLSFYDEGSILWIDL